MKKMIKIHTFEGEKEVEHTVINDEWAYRKSDYYILTHIPTGKRFGMFKKVSTIRELLKEDCFFNDKYVDYSKEPPISWREVRVKYYNREFDEIKKR